MARLRVISGMILAGALGGCGLAPAPQGGATPTVQAVVVTDTLAPSASATATATVPILIETAAPTSTSLPPTASATPTATPGPYEHTIQQGETLGFIIQLYGYTDLSTVPGSVIAQIVAINGLPDADSLPGAGTVILIPRQTPVPTPENVQTAAANPQPNVVVDSQIEQYVVQEGDTVLKIAADYSTTIAILAVLNPELNIFGCNFDIPSGGPNCNPSIRVGQALNVPAPTPTPTLSPTPSGNETATPTPTYAAPRPIFPPEGATAPAGVFSLQWVSVGVLAADEVYLVVVTDTVSGAVYQDVTRATALMLPGWMIPSDGQIHTMNWTVQVARRNEQGVYQPIGAPPITRTYRWQSR